MGLSNQYNIGYGYNNEFRLETFTYAGETEAIFYDDDGMLDQVGGYTIARDQASGFPQSITGGGLTLTPGFNDYGEMDDWNFNAGGNGLYQWHLDYYDNGLIERKTETADGETHVYERNGDRQAC